MLFLVRMNVKVPGHLTTEAFDALKLLERDRAQALQQSGKWRHLWRVVGKYENVSIFDVVDGAELHALLIDLPLFPYMSISVDALCDHPSALKAVSQPS
jgi:muconolactone D-isomerase